MSSIPSEYSIKQKLELCLTIGQEKGINKQSLDKDKSEDIAINSPRFKFVNCQLPHFFFCYKEARLEEKSAEKNKTQQPLSANKIGIPKITNYKSGKCTVL